MAGCGRFPTMKCRRTLKLWAWAGGLLLATFQPSRAGALAAPTPGEFLAKSWHTEDGLPDGNIAALAETPDGYLWIGSFGGLARFDGVRFTVFDQRRAPILAGRRITGLLVDRAGRLWIAGEGGAVFRYAEGRFEAVDSGTAAGASELASVRSTHSRWLRPTELAEDLDGGIWMRPAGGGVRRVAPAAPPGPAPTGGPNLAGPAWLVPDPGRQPWVLARDVLWRFGGGTWGEPWRVPGLAQGEPVFRAAREGGLWVAAPRRSWADGGGRVAWLHAGQVRDDLPPTPWATNSPRSQVTALLEDHADRLWLGTHWGGVLRLERGAWRPPVAEGVLTQCRVTCLFEDRRGAIWVGTLGDGLHRLTRRPVTGLRPPPPAADHILNTVCATRNGDVWLGTDGAGAFRYRDGKFQHFGQAEGLGSDLVMSLCEDTGTNLWCGTAGGLFRERAGRFEPVTAPEANLGYVLAMLADRAGRLWFGTPRGVVRHDAGQFKLFPHGLPGGVEIRSLAEDAAGDLWLGTIAHGLLRLRGDEITRFGVAEGLTHPDARSLWADPAGGLWVGTLGGGLFRLRDGRFAAITHQDGLPDATINGLVADDLGNLWCSSYNGFFGGSLRVLENWRPGRGTPLVFRRFSLAEGLDHRACSGAGQPVVSRGPDGRLWFVNQRSVGVIDPRAVSGGDRPTQVLIESATVDGIEWPAQTGEKVRVSSGARRFEIRYTALHLPQPTEARFRHRLASVDPDWVNAGDQRVAYYGQLPPGAYTFAVTAAGADGVWQTAPRGLTIEVTPRWWERPLVRAGAAALLLAGVAATVGLTVRARLRRRLSLLERQRASEQERSRIARDMHDELGAGLTQISFLTALAHHSAEDPAEVRTQGTKIAGLARKLVHSLDEIVWAVRPQNDHLESLVEYLGQSTRDLCEGSGVRCWFTMPPAVPSVEVPANARHNVILACREAVNNVLKHSGATELRMTVQLDGPQLGVAISDNGHGFDVATGEAKRSGLTHMRARLEEVGGACEFRSAPDAGTTVRFTLPLGGVGQPA